MTTHTLTDPTTTTDLPSAPVLAQAQQELASIASQKQEAAQRTDQLRREQADLLTEQQQLIARREALEQTALGLAKELQQCETDARLASTSPVAAKTALAALHAMRKRSKTDDALRHKELTQIETRLAEISRQLETLRTSIGSEQATATALSQQEAMVRISRDKSFAALGEELFASHTARLDQLRAHLDEVAAAFVNAQVALREAKDETYVALGQHAAQREKAIHQYDLLEDENTRIYDGFAALYDILEKNGEKLVHRIGTHHVLRDLAFTVPEMEQIIARPIEYSASSRQSAMPLSRSSISTSISNNSSLLLFCVVVIGGTRPVPVRIGLAARK